VPGIAPAAESCAPSRVAAIVGIKNAIVDIKNEIKKLRAGRKRTRIQGMR
jgi:hypothetical protein